MFRNKKIAVLMGGRSGEREVSLRSGKRVFDSLKSQGFDVIALDPDENLIPTLKREKVDIAFIALHGQFGEDGRVQGLLEMEGIPYTGSKVLASALAMNKITSKMVFQSVGIPTPKFVTIDSNDSQKESEKVLQELSWPVVVKPVAEGSSLGVTIVKEKKDLEEVLAKTQKEFGEIFVEEYIKGKEVTVGILGKNSDLKALPILELVPKTEFYDYHAKYTAGQTEFVLPAQLPKKVYQETQRVALAAHQALGCYGVSRVDIIVDAKGTPYAHDVNTIPGMTDRSDLPAQAQHAGISFDQLVLEILESAL